MPDHRLLILFAHPDDEAFPVGGTIAMHTARGVTARLITTTSGELGEIRQPGSATRETIGEVRRGELAEAIKELGIESHEVLGYRDSGMAGWDDNHHPKAFVQADEHEVVARLVFEIRRFKPQVILTFGMDGLYGHPDHIAICQHATTAFRLAADETAADDDRIIAVVARDVATDVVCVMAFKTSRCSDVPLDDSVAEPGRKAFDLRLDSLGHVDVRSVSGVAIVRAACTAASTILE